MRSRLAIAVVFALSAIRVAGAQDSHIQRVYWELDSSGYHFEPERLTVYRGDTVRFLVRSGPPHSLTFDSTAIPALALEPLRRLMARLPRASDEPFATRSLYNVGETVNIPTDSLPPGRYSFYCEEHDDEEGLLIINERPGSSFADYFGSIGSENADIWSGDVIDSLVVERTACTSGSCPAYRFTLARSGAVQFRLGGAGGNAAPVAASVPRAAVVKVFDGAGDAGLFVLPSPVAEDQQLCPVRGGGRTILTVTAYRRGARRQVEYNTGCYVSTLDRGLIVADPLARFAVWEAGIESTIGVGKWLH